MPEDRKDRLAQAMVEGQKNAVRAPEVVAARRAKLGADLEHIQAELEPHGLSVGAMLRSVAKHFHGVTVSPLPDEPADSAEG